MTSTHFNGTNHGFQIGNSYSSVTAEFHQAYTTEDIDRFCLHDLRCPDSLVVKTRLKETKDKLQPQSFGWIFQTPQYKSWRYGRQTCLLWIKGGAGKGKTMISIGLIEELSQQESTVVTYFFCQDADNELNTLHSIIKGLILRLLNQQPGLKESLRRRWNTKQDRFNEDVTSWRTLWNILFEMLDRCNSEVYIIVDALDECQGEDMAEFLKLIVRNGLDQPAKIKWLLTSRPFDSAERSLLTTGHDQLQISLELNSRYVSEAVNAYISHKVDELSHHRYGETLKRKVKAELTAKADGTFLWVSLVCKKLENVRQDEALATIQSLPPGLHSLYDRILNQISQGEIDDVKKSMRLLKAMVLVYRPLKVEEILSVTALTNEEAMKLVNRCASFIKLQGNTIQFIHHSARDYLAGVNGQYMLDLHEHFGHYEILLGCLSHLSKCLKINLADLPRPDSSEHPCLRQSIQLASLDYAATFWVQHLRSIERRTTVESGLIEKGAVGIFLHAKLLEWLESLSLLDQLPRAMEALNILLDITEDNPSAFTTALVQDADRFLLRHYHTLTYWPLQIYSSGIIFSPDINTVKRINLDKIPFYLRKVPRMEDTWTFPIHPPGHSKYITTMAFSPDGKHFASGSDDKTIKIWDTGTGDLRKTLKGHSNYVSSVAFSPDGKQIASSSNDKTIKLWHTATGNLQKTLVGHLHWVGVIGFSFDGKQIVSGSSDTTIKLWDTATGELQKTLSGHSNYITSVAFSPDGKQIASCSRDNTIKLWNIAKGDLQKTLEGHTSGVISVAFSPDGKQIASCSYDRTIRLWDLAKFLKTSKAIGHQLSSRLRLRSCKEIQTTEQVYSVEFSVDGGYLATDIGPIMLDDVASEEEVGRSASLGRLFVKDQWICYGKMSFLRLPSDTRPVCHAVQGDQVAIGLENGGVLRFDIDRSSLQSILEESPGFRI